MQPTKQSIFRRIYRLLLGHPIARWFVILGSIIYLISPVDISPDVVPIVGWIDDGVIATFLATGLVEIVLERRRNQKAQKAGNSTYETQATSTEDQN